MLFLMYRNCYNKTLLWMYYLYSQTSGARNNQYINITSWNVILVCLVLSRFFFDDVEFEVYMTMLCIMIYYSYCICILQLFCGSWITWLALFSFGLSLSSFYIILSKFLVLMPRCHSSHWWLNLQALVGIGYKGMRVMRVKNLNLYAFGLCELKKF